MCRWPGGCAEYPDSGSYSDDRNNDNRENASGFPYPAPDQPAPDRGHGHPARWHADSGIQELKPLPVVHLDHRASRSMNSASRGSSRNLASARDIALLTVPTEQFSTCATCDSGRSS